MKEIVINACFGGFSLSEEAFELYLKKKGTKYYTEESKFSFGGKSYYAVPPEKYHRLSEKWREEDGDYRRINSKKWYLSDRDIERTDPLLIEVIKELGKKANGRCAQLKVVRVPDDVEWEIEEYDGSEWVSEKHRKWD